MYQEDEVKFMSGKFFPHLKELVEEFITKNSKGLKKKLKIFEISDFLKTEGGKTIIVSTIKRDELNASSMARFIGGIVTQIDVTFGSGFDKNMIKKLTAKGAPLGPFQELKRKILS